MENEKKNIKADLYKICWYMRGSITFDDAFYLTAEDKEIIGKIVKENIEATKNTKMPMI
jgi:hypothetical protein